MKKTLALLVGVLGCATAFAGAEDVRIMFSTPGPDAYADKTAVKVGERYALVWKKSADDVVSFSADGTVTGGKAVLVWDTKENGHCSKVFFTVNETWLKNQDLSGGVWSVYLLDTRVFAEDGSYTYSARNDAGIPTVINNTGVAIENAASVASVTGSAVAGGTATTIPDGVGQPKIRGIEVDGSFVYVTVENTSPCVNYVITEGATPDAQFAVGADSKPQQGNGTITLVTPKTADTKFFKVNRK